MCILTYIHTYVYWPLPQRGFSVPITKEKIKIKTYTNNLKLQLQIIRISFLPLKFVWKHPSELTPKTINIDAHLNIII